MKVSFSEISVGSKWTRQKLADLWNYAAYQAIARGVVTPAGDNKIILFVSEEKPEDFTQYENGLHGKTLIWEGEKGHGSDARIANAAKSGDGIYVFHRHRHRDLFTYLGIVRVVKFEHQTTVPSKAVFELTD